MVLSRVRNYKPEEINLDELSRKAEQILQRKPFQWQLDAASAILQGNDVIVDVGTGSGKTLCFSLPLLQHETDMALTVSPLSALMIDQVCYRLLNCKSLLILHSKKADSAELSTVAVCAETMQRVGEEKLYEVCF